MRRPLPTLPHGPRRRRQPAPARGHLVACPKVSPEWEFGALRALMKPHEWTRGAIAHTPALQPLPPGAAALVEEAVAVAGARLNLPERPLAHFPGEGDFAFVVEFPAEQRLEALATAAVLSVRLPGLWISVDALYLRDGRFFRRKRSNTLKFSLAPAANVHLPRDLRAALRGLLTPPRRPGNRAGSQGGRRTGG